MSFKIDKNRGGNRFTSRQIGLSTKDSNESRGIGAPQYEFYELEPAEVIDIILDDKHPDFSDYRDIGKAKIRFVVSENGKDKALLSYAKPIQSNIKQFPLIGEIVIAINYLNELWYSDRLNIKNNINENAQHGISLPDFTSQYSGKKKASDYEDVYVSGIPNIKNQNGNLLGKTFIKSDVKPSQLKEGDIILEGRFGNHIKLSSENDSIHPNIIISVGQPDEVPNEEGVPIVDDINLFKNLIWISTMDDIPLTTATSDSKSEMEFYKEKPSVLNGNQIIMNSDRIVLNSKMNEAMIFSKKAINLASSGIITIDSDDETIINSKSKLIIESPNIYLGKNDATEPLVLGETLKKIIEELVDYILNHKHPSASGGTGIPLPPEYYKIEQWKTKIDSALSKQNFSV